MAIEWGSWEGSSPTRIRVGIDVSWEAITHGETAATATVKYYTDVEGNWSDSQTLNLTGAITGSVSFTNNQSNNSVLRETRTEVYNYGNCEYGSSPGTKTFACNLTGAFNGATPSKSVTKNIPARPYAAPAAPTNVSSTRISDSSLKTTWTNKDTCGEPWDTVRIQYDVGDNDVWNGDVGTTGGGGTSFTYSSAVANSAYRFRVRSENSINDSDWVEGDLLYTTPAVPTNVTRTGANGANQTINWTNNVYSLMDHRIAVERAQDSGSGYGAWTEITLAPRDSVSFIDTFPATNPSIKFKYRVKGRTWGGAQGVLYSAASNETTPTSGLSTPPSAPTNLSPSNNTIINPTQSRVFTWQHNPTDSAVQTAYELQYRVVGAGSWITTGKVVSGTASRTVAASTFTDNSDYEWQVRTWGAATTGGSETTGASVFSASALFETVGDPNARREQQRVMRLNLETGRQETAGVGVLPPIGSITMFGGAAAPSGWLLCHGQSLVRADYPDLFGVIGTLFGSVDGTHFTLPDMRHRLPIGANDDGLTVFDLGASDGRTSQTSRSDSHSHSHSHGHTLGTGSTGSSHTHNITGQVADPTPATSGTAATNVPRHSHYSGHAHGGDTGSTGSGHTHNVTGAVSTVTGIVNTETTAHSWQAVNYIIKI